MKYSTNAEYRITGRESLHLLFTKRKNRYRKFILDVEHMEEIKAKKFENDLNKFHGSCGCETGKYFLSTSIVLCAAFISYIKLPLNDWEIIAKGIALFLIVAFIGKFIGKWMDRLKFNKTIEKLSYELKS